MQITQPACCPPATPPKLQRLSAPAAIQQHWRLYVYEGMLLAIFMMSACTFTALMEYPLSPVARAIPSPFLRRVVIGLAMGLTAVVLIYSPAGKRSGAHMNPAITLGFLRLAKIQPWDALFYMAGQFIGGAVGVFISALLLGHKVIADAAVNYIVTIPGIWGTGVAWLAEFAISFLLMGTVLLVNQFPKLSRFTGWFAGALIVLFVMFEAPISGFGMNPARTFGSAIMANIWTAGWIYFTAPVLGMLAGIEIHHIFIAEYHLLCPRLNHSSHGDKIHPCVCLANGEGNRDNSING